MSHRPSFCALSTVLTLGACTGGFDTGGKDDTGPPPVDALDSDTSDEETDETEDTEETAEEEAAYMDPGVLTGTINFQLYTTDSSGAVEYLEWKDWYGEDFPFGAVFVSGYTVDDEGETTWWSNDILADPDPTGSEYELEFGFDEETEVYVYAALDYWGDGLVAPYDPSEVYGAAVPVIPEATLSGIDLTVLVPYYDFSTPGGGYWNPDDWILISGEARVSEVLAGGSCMALVYDTTDYGPYGYNSFVPTDADDGASGTYSVYAPKNMGASHLLGACDTNLNSLIEPSDAWGGYTEDGEEVAELTIASYPLDDYTLTIPLGDSESVDRPDVNYGGTVSLDDLTMEKVTDSSVLYVTAQKYRVDSSFDPDASGRTHDVLVWSGSEIAATNAYSLSVPSNTVIYVWACLDSDADGVVNEAGESCGQPVLDGRVATGSRSSTDVDFWIHTMEPGGG